MACGSRKRPYSNPGSLTVIGRFSLGAESRLRPTIRTRCADLGLNSPCPAVNCGEPHWSICRCFPSAHFEAFYLNGYWHPKPDPKTSKPDPAVLQAFVAGHPETRRQAMKMHQVGAEVIRFANSTFHSLNAFWFVNAAGDSTAIRWVLTPEQPFRAAEGSAAAQDKNYLFDGLIAELHRHKSLR